MTGANRGIGLETARQLTIRAEFLPDDAKWDTGKMPTLIHTMPLARAGFTFGMIVETSYVTIQGLKLLGIPGCERGLRRRRPHHETYQVSSDLVPL